MYAYFSINMTIWRMHIRCVRPSNLAILLVMDREEREEDGVGEVRDDSDEGYERVGAL